jgi:hypothetical protein
MRRGEDRHRLLCRAIADLIGERQSYTGMTCELIAERCWAVVPDASSDEMTEALAELFEKLKAVCGEGPPDMPPPRELMVLMALPEPDGRSMSDADIDHMVRCFFPLASEDKIADTAAALRDLRDRHLAAGIVVN